MTNHSIFNRLSVFFSYLLHPLFIPFYGYCLLLFTPNYYAYFFSPTRKLLLLGIVLTFTCVLPILNLFILQRLKLIHSLRLDDSSQRTIPYLITSFFYFGLAYMLWTYQLPSVFKSLIISGAICILLTLLINLKWKISAHMTGMGGLTGATIALSLILKQNFIFWLHLIIALAGVLGFSRIKLDAHTPAQVYVGYIMGLIVTFVLVILFYVIDLSIFP